MRSGDIVGKCISYTDADGLRDIVLNRQDWLAFIPAFPPAALDNIGYRFAGGPPRTGKLAFHQSPCSNIGKISR